MHKNLFKSPTVTYLLAMGLQSTPLACEDATAMTFEFIPGLAK